MEVSRVAADWWEPDDGGNEFGLFDRIQDNKQYPTTDEYVVVDSGPFSCLLKAEIRQIEIKANMTVQQALAFDYAMVYGLNNCEIADVMEICESGVRKHLEMAVAKTKKVPHIGMLTIIVEEFGWKGFRDLMQGKY